MMNDYVHNDYINRNDLVKDIKNYIIKRGNPYMASIGYLALDIIIKQKHLDMDEFIAPIKAELDEAAESHGGEEYFVELGTIYEILDKYFKE